MFEPMVIGIVFPFLHRAPWQVRSTPKMLSVDRQLRKVWVVSDMAQRNFLRTLLLDHEWLQSLPADVVPHMLYYEQGSYVSYKGESGPCGGKQKRTKRTSAVDCGVGKETSAQQPV
jgi:hypothetical protein